MPAESTITTETSSPPVSPVSVATPSASRRPLISTSPEGSVVEAVSVMTPPVDSSVVTAYRSTDGWKVGYMPTPAPETAIV